MNINFILAILSSLIILALVYYYTNKSINENNNMVKNMVSIAIGIMLTIASTHLLPETFSNGSELSGYIFLFSLLMFYILGWVTHNHNHDHSHNHHSHIDNNKISKKDLSIVPSMFGIAIHSLSDGIAIGVAFHISVPFGIILSIAIALHHIPQMSGIALTNKSYFSLNVIKLFNLLTSSFILIGVILSFVVASSQFDVVISYLIAVSAASFIYVGGYDLVTYLKENIDYNIKRRIFLVIIGVVIGLLAETISHNGEGDIHEDHIEHIEYNW